MLQQLYDSLRDFRALGVLMRTDYGQVESVAFDIDYRSKVTRATFEEALADLKPTFTQPITDALNNADLTLVSSELFLSTHFA
jgi:molecular chaperone DnaK (HSP70)